MYRKRADGLEEYGLYTPDAAKPVGGGPSGLAPKFVGGGGIVPGLIEFRFG